MRRAAAISVLLVLLSSSLTVPGGAGAGEAGPGTEERDGSRGTTSIYNVHDLQNMSLDLKGSYELANDIDASATLDWNNGTGFVPVGNKTCPFNGTLDGKGYNISGLSINRPTTAYVGLFGYAGKDSSLKNTGLRNVNMTGRDYVGGLAGFNYCGAVNNSYVSGKVSGRSFTGGLVGSINDGTVNNSYCTGEVAATEDCAGGLAGSNGGCLSNSYFTGNVSGISDVGGLVGITSDGAVDRCHATGNVTGTGNVGGLVGDCHSYSSTMKSSYFSGNVTGTSNIGGLLGTAEVAALSNSHYNIDSVAINGGHHITMGALLDAQYQDWYSNDLSLNISEYGSVLVACGESYNISNISGLRDLLGFSDVSGYRFRLVSDIDLSNESGLYIPYLAAVFDGDNHTMTNLSINLSFVSCLGMFGFNNAGSIMNTGIVKNRIDGYDNVGGLVGDNKGAVNNSYATGNVDGAGSVGGLVGNNDGAVNNSHAAGNVNGAGSVGGLVGYLKDHGAVNNSHATGNVSGTRSVGGLVGSINSAQVKDSHATGNVNGSENIGGLAGYMDYCSASNSYATGNVNGSSSVGGLVGQSYHSTLKDSYATGNVTGDYDVGGLVGYNLGTLSNAHYNVDEVSIRGEHLLAAGGLLDAQYQDWFSNGLTLNISKYNSSLEPSGGLYNISSVQGMKDLLGFSDVRGYKFRLVSDLDLSNHSGLYIPYLAADFDGNRHEISNMRFNSSFNSFAGMFGHNNGGTINNVWLAGNRVNGNSRVGGLVGYNQGTVNNSCSTGNVNGTDSVGGLVGYNDGPVSNSRATGNVTGTEIYVGGLVGFENYNSVTNSHATGNVTGDRYVGGLVGFTMLGTVSGSYATGNVAGGYGVGGLMGQSTASLYNTYAAGNVTGTEEYAGGLVGLNKGSVSKSYSAGHVAGTASVGGLTGNSSGTVSSCFWDNETSGQSQSSGGTGKVTAEMKTRSTFTDAGWNFDTVWWMMENVTYPVLRWQDIMFPVADAGIDQTVDEDTVVTFNGSGSFDSFGIANYTWTFRDVEPQNAYGVGPSYKFNNPGTFDVTLNVFNIVGNRDNDTMTVTVNDITPPVSRAGTDQIVDEGTLVTFNGSGSSDNGVIVNYTWTFKDGAPVSLYGARPTYTFDNPGFFVVTLNVTDAGRNWNASTMNVTVNDITCPVADAGPDVVIDEWTSLMFNGSNSSDNVGIVNYTWTFMDGSPVTLYGIGPTYLFGNPGIFVVTLNVTDAAGNHHADTMTVTVRDTTAPVADAGIDVTIDEGTLLTFNGSGSSDRVGVVNYTWTFMDGSLVTLFGIGPAYLFGNPGIFVVTLNVTDAAGNHHTDTMTVTVRDTTAPVADAGIDVTIDEGTLLAFNGSGSFDRVGVVNYTWTFMDGYLVTLFGIGPTHLFGNPGIFVVTLNVTDAAGNHHTDTMTVTVRDITAPVADAGIDVTIDEGTLLAFNGSGSFDRVGVVNYTWTFMDGSLVTLFGIGPTHLFGNPGIFVVTLNVTDAAGNHHTDTMTVTVRDITAPFADAGPDRTIDEGTLLTFDGSNSSDNVGIAGYAWTFTDGETVTLDGARPIYTFVHPGIFVVTLNVTDSEGNRGTDTLTVTVNDITAPVADAGPDRTVDEDTVVNLDGTESSDNVGIVNYSWTFACGTGQIVLYGVSAAFSFDVPGVYLVSLIVADAAGNRREDAMTLAVRDITPPVADAGPDRTVPAESVVALDGSLSTDNGAMAGRRWNFIYDGKAQSLEGETVSFKFDKGGRYELVLTVTDTAGNLDEDTAVITVIDTGRVLGTASDQNRNPVKGAAVEIFASNGRKYTARTGANGSFTIDILHGNFTWKIARTGYTTISGTSSVKAMDEVDLNLFRTPMTKESVEGPSDRSLVPVLLAIMAIAAAYGIGAYAVRKRRRGKNVEPSASRAEPAPEGPMTPAQESSVEPPGGGA